LANFISYLALSVIYVGKVSLMKMLVTTAVTVPYLIEKILKNTHLSSCKMKLR
jgi:hypothetical protein